MQFSDLFYRNGRLTAVVVGLIVVAGIAAFTGLGRQEDPSMAERYALVRTFLPGASAQRVEALVTEKIERQLRGLAEIKTIESTSRAGLSLLTIELYDSVEPDLVDNVWSEARSKLGEIRRELPAGSSAPQLEPRSPRAATLVLALTWHDASQPQLSVLTRLAQDLQIKLANLPGTHGTNLHGEAREEIAVEADSQKLATLGLTVEHVAQAIAQSDTKMSAGRLQGDSSNLLVEVAGELTSVERIKRIPIAGASSARWLRVGDVAGVSKYVLDPPQTKALIDGKRAVVVDVTMEDGQRIDLWVAKAKEKIETFRRTLPNGINLQIVFDQDVYTSERLSSLLINLLSALIIVVAVLVIFMGIRSALAVAVSLPLSMAMVLVGLYAMGITLDQMSITGLIISLGLLIDNAIVMVESFNHRRQHGDDVVQAIQVSVKRLWVPLLASTLTTMLAFIPIATAPGSTGEFISAMAVAVVLSVASSFFLAMTVTPAVAAYLEKWFAAHPDDQGKQSWWRHGITFAQITRVYRQSLRWSVQKPRRGVALGLMLPLVGFALAPTLTLQFFPATERDLFQIQLSMPAHTSLRETENNVAAINAALRQFPDIVGTAWYLGSNGPRVYYNMQNSSDGVASFASAVVKTTSAAATAELLPRLQTLLKNAVADGRVLVAPFEQGPPFNAPIELRVVGQDLGILKNIGEQLRLILSGVSDVTYTAMSQQGAEPKLALYANPNELALAGMSMSDLPAQLHQALLGTVGATVMEGTQELAVRVRTQARTRENVDRVASLPLVGDTMIPLDQLARMTVEPAVAAITHYQGERHNTVMGFLSPYVLPAEVMARFQQRLAAADVFLPDGYRIEYGGEQAERSESVASLFSTFAVYLVLMIGAVVLSLNSFKQAGIVALVAVLAVGLALFGIRLFGYPLGITAIVGALGLIGLGINGAVIVLAALNQDRRARDGDREASVNVVAEATRHIVATTVTTIGGFVPLILVGGSFWPPLATAIAGGVLGSAILALYFVPALFLVTRRGQPPEAVDSPATVVSRFAGRWRAAS